MIAPADYRAFVRSCSTSRLLALFMVPGMATKEVMADEGIDSPIGLDEKRRVFLDAVIDEIDERIPSR
jgi:hypothetical protein